MSLSCHVTWDEIDALDNAARQMLADIWEIDPDLLSPEFFRDLNRRQESQLAYLQFIEDSHTAMRTGAKHPRITDYDPYWQEKVKAWAQDIVKRGATCSCQHPPLRTPLDEEVEAFEHEILAKTKHHKE